MTRTTDSRKRKQPEDAGDQVADSVHHVGRRHVMLALGGVAVAAVGAIGYATIFPPAPASAEEVVIYKSPSCECCGRWSSHLRHNGFAVSIKNVEDMDPIKKQAGVPYDMESCHTAFIGGYVVEGHVPAENIRKILAERPGIKGLAVPGMPASSPGMDGPDPEPYTVYSFDEKGKTAVFASY
jgi:hypothetical protein